MDDRFYTAFLPPEVRVCGRWLGKFSLWHHLLLHAISSPVVTGGDLRAADILAAARICGRKYGDRSSFRPSLRDVLWTWRLNRSRSRLRREAEALYLWIGHHGKGPLFWRPQDEGTHISPSGPSCLGLAASLMTRGGMSRAEAWDTSIGEAQWLDAAFAKIEGIPIHFVDEEMISEDPIDLSQMTDAEALAMFTRDLPPGLVEASFAYWKKNQKGVARA